MDEYESLEYKPSLAIRSPKSLGTLVKWYNLSVIQFSSPMYKNTCHTDAEKNR